MRDCVRTLTKVHIHEYLDNNATRAAVAADTATALAKGRQYRPLQKLYGIYFIHWVDPSPAVMLGQPVKIDQGRVVYAIPAMVPSLRLGSNHARITMLHPAVGTAMVKEKGSARPKLTSTILRFHNMVEVGSADAADDSSPLDYCDACGRDALMPESGLIERCCICLNSWHATCNDSIASYRVAVRPMSLRQPACPMLPACLMTGHKCRMCADAIAHPAQAG